MQFMTFENRLRDAVTQAMQNLETIDLFAVGVLKTAQIKLNERPDGVQEARIFLGNEPVPVQNYEIEDSANLTDDALVADIQQLALAAVATTGQAIWDCHCRNCGKSWQDTAADRAAKLESEPAEQGERCPFCGSTDLSASPHASAVEREQHEHAA